MLEKLWGLPAHPVYVHFPVAFFILSSLFLGLHQVDGESHRVRRFLKKIRLGDFDFESFSLLALLAGCGMGVVAILSGLALVGGWDHAPFPHAPLGISAVACYSILLMIRWVFGPSLYKHPLRYLYFGLHLLGVVLVTLAGFKGGELHYS